MTNQHPTITRLERDRAALVRAVVDAGQDQELAKARMLAGELRIIDAMLDFIKAQQAARLAAA